MNLDSRHSFLHRFLPGYALDFLAGRHAAARLGSWRLLLTSMQFWTVWIRRLLSASLAQGCPVVVRLLRISASPSVVWGYLADCLLLRDDIRRLLTAGVSFVSR